MTANLEKIKFWVIKPKAMTNMITNPSIETNDTGYTVVGAGVTKARVATYQRRGAWSLEITPVDSVESGAYFGDVTVVNGTVYTVSVDVYAPDGVNFFLKVLNTSATSRGLTTFSGNDSWTRETLTFTAAADEDVRIYVTRMDSETGVLPFYIDGLQMEANSEATTYFDGDMVGFVPTRNDFGWNGTRHGSTSYRTAKTRAGGELVYLGVQGSDDYRVMQTSGLGMGSFVQTYTNIITGGMLYEKHSRTPRTFSLKLDFGHNDNIGEIMAKRAEIIDAIRPDFVDDQPMIVRMQGWDASMLNEAGEPVDVPCVPLTPLENIPDNPYLHQAIITFLATDALLPGAFHEGAQLDFADSLTNANYILYRDADGVWKEIGTGSTGTIYSLAEAPNGDIWIGGNFASINGVSAHNIAKWDGSTITAPISGIGSTVYDIAIDSQGNVYFCGDFEEGGGDPSIDFLAKWDGSSLSNVGSLTLSPTPLFGRGLRGLKFDSLDNLYICGAFLNASSIANADYIAKYNGSSWSAVGVPVAGTAVVDFVHSIAIDSNNNVYVGGSFSNFADDANCDSIAKWNGSSWESLGVGVNYVVYKMIFDDAGNLYATGTFNQAGGVTANRIAKWNGSKWDPLGSGFSYPGGGGYGRSLSLLGDGAILAGGMFRAADGNEIYDGFAIWNQETWLPLNVDLPGVPDGYASLQTKDGRLFIGFNSSGTATSAGLTTAQHSGGAVAYPIIDLYGPGLISQIKNFTSGAQITFNNLTLLTGEILTLNLEPDNLTIKSSFRGNCLNYIAPGSDLASFYLQPGTNNITLMMTGTDADTDAVIYWSPAYWSLDQTKYGV